jgi:hypothetical protein
MHDPDITGVYLAWKSLAMHLLPLDKNASGCGDVFTAKLKDPEWGECGWTAYLSVLQSPFLSKRNNKGSIQLNIVNCRCTELPLKFLPKEPSDA